MSSFTYTTAAEQLTALREKFDPTLIKTREQAGQTMSYFPSHVIHNRLLDVLGTGLSMTSEHVITTEDRIDMQVRLSITWVDGTLSRVDGWGSADIMRSKATQKITSDSYKVAYTDALKICASKLGCALELYDKDYLKSLEGGGSSSDEDEEKPTRPARRMSPPADAPTPRMDRFKKGA